MTRLLRVRLDPELAKMVSDLCDDDRSPSELVRALIRMAHRVRFHTAYEDQS